MFKKISGMAGIYFIGMYKTTYKNLVKLFGEPHKVLGKGFFEWNLKFDNGIRVSIYDYGRDEFIRNPESITNWHIGGYKTKAYHFIYLYIKNNGDERRINRGWIKNVFDPIEIKK